MAGPVSPHTGSNTVPTSGPVSKGHNDFMNDDNAVATMLSSFDKGGMRGVALILFTIGEILLKQQAVDIAKDYYKLNKEDYDFFTNLHQGSIAQSAAEAMSPVDNPAYNHDYYASAPAGMQKAALLDKQWFETRRRAHRYATGVQKRVDYDFAMLRLHGIVAGWNVGRRYEMTYADEHNNRRFDRKVEMANIGLGIGAVVRSGLASASNGLASSFDHIGDTVSTIGNGLAANSGYKAGRQYAANKYPNRQDVGTEQSRNQTDEE